MMLGSRKAKKEKKVKKRKSSQYDISKAINGGASNASRWLQKEIEKKEQIHNLMKQTAAVRNMRDNYARNMFYVGSVLSGHCILLCGFIFSFSFNNYLWYEGYR